jgi:hypothetical protein
MARMGADGRALIIRNYPRDPRLIHLRFMGRTDPQRDLGVNWGHEPIHEGRDAFHGVHECVSRLKSSWTG